MEDIKWDEKGLVPVVVQDFRTKDVLMVAYMNNEALELTLKTKTAHYYSRSRKKIWLKGETSGHTQEVHGVYLDCDNDTILITVDQKVAACHTGFWSCFYRIWEGGWKVVGKKIFDEKKVYGDKGE
ncbi:MAG TPA: phosphoribosyl-AMP cyclohydrolase [Syntrophorhabdaceae bacterium]|jgi:phosphoribosyl-AMP cyclohydrolase|nr:phosphoribosyl-AMP cyclohydrolase [Syntrophorhabdaceae bacterium]HQM80851.1 phosphoribosyl-AMP cyclohydrolase [Syntrophorhabdaceae bacterium]